MLSCLCRTMPLPLGYSQAYASMFPASNSTVAGSAALGPIVPLPHFSDIPGLLSRPRTVAVETGDEANPVLDTVITEQFIDDSVVQSQQFKVYSNYLSWNSENHPVVGNRGPNLQLQRHYAIAKNTSSPNPAHADPDSYHPRCVPSLQKL